jgi:integrase/recombinase XerD
MESLTLQEAGSAFEVYCRAKGLSPKTIQTYAHAVQKLRSYLRNGGPPSLPTTTQLRSFLVVLSESGLSPASVAIHARSLRAFFNFLATDGMVDRSPMQGVPIPRAPSRFPEIITKEQARRLLNAARRSTWTGKRNAAILATFLDTGMRLSELIGLNLEDVDLRRLTIRIRSGKGDKERHVYMGRALLRAIRRWLDVRGFHEEGTPFYLTKAGNRLDLRNVERIVGRIAERARLGSVRITPHILRHTFATHYIQNGGDPFSLQRILGHSDIKTTMIYVNLAGVGLQEAHAKASPVDRLLG